MKLIKFSAAITLTISLITACKKEDKTPSSVAGFWRGRVYYDITNITSTDSIAVLFKTNSTCRLYYFDSNTFDTSKVSKIDAKSYTVNEEEVRIVLRSNASEDLTYSGSVNNGFSFIEGFRDLYNFDNNGNVSNHIRGTFSLRREK